MLERFDKLIKYKLKATDREMGRVKDLYFDDSSWTTRYLVADTGSWLTDKSILISPQAVASVDPKKRHIDTTLSAEQVENSPPPESELPVSRQLEMVYSYSWGEKTMAEPVPPGKDIQEREGWDPSLRSAKEVEGYQVHALDHNVGHIVDFVVDDTDWVIRYFVVDTRNWWPSKHVLLSPAWATDVDWAMRTVSVDVTRDMIRQAPEYDEDQAITREYELRLFEHYCKDCYWTE